MWTSTACFYAASIFFKIMLFNVLWCLQTTFTAFSYPQTYINTILATLILVSPYMLARSNRLQILVLLLIDAHIICNLMYSRTYNAIIPLTSYALAGNLSEFMPSVVDSLRIVDILFPLSTIAAVIFTAKRGKEKHKRMRLNRVYGFWTLGFMAVSFTMIMSKGGITKAFARYQDANHYTCVVPMYTIWGNMWHESLQDNQEFLPAMKKEIDAWLASKPQYKALPDSIGKRTNLVVILCESLESWPLEKRVEGKELTPNLNSILKDSTTLYAPNVLTQVRGGRSIDAQLILNAGLLPVENGCYAVLYPNNNYKTLTKAVTKQEPHRSFLLTVDKEVTWNQGVVARSFGIDSIVSKPDWVLDEKVGNRKKLGDVSFAKQAVAKLQNKELWTKAKNNYLQFVTYSGHNPFVLPENLQRISFKGEYPDKMKDYMIMANYTDHALGILLKYLKSRPDYKNTLIVITGDHEGLASDRDDIMSSPIGKKIVSNKQFTPFIVVNSPIGGRYNSVMGQIDMYPTILNLMHLDNYDWKGMGQSIFDSQKARIAVAPDLHIEGNTRGVSKKEIERLQKAYRIADLIVKYNPDITLKKSN